VLDVSAENFPWRRGATRETITLHSVLHTLAYADVFDYPLTAPEVYRYLTSPAATFEEVTSALSDKSRFSQVGEFFTLTGREEIVETRKRRAEVARRLWPKAARYGRVIAQLPFVRMVAITGSLAMNNTDEGKDVDYMIVTAPNHLWTCRALALLVARIARLEDVTLCPNYLITTNALQLEERSLYVAHELAQMIPLAGLEIYGEICSLNHWIYDYLPHAFDAPDSPSALQEPAQRSAIQKGLEFILSLPFGAWLEKWEMNRKIKRLSREQAHSVESYFSADVCKGHIDKHGESVVTALSVRLKNASTPALVDSTREVAATKTI